MLCTSAGKSAIAPPAALAWWRRASPTRLARWQLGRGERRQHAAPATHRHDALRPPREMLKTRMPKPSLYTSKALPTRAGDTRGAAICCKSHNRHLRPSRVASLPRRGKTGVAAGAPVRIDPHAHLERLLLLELGHRRHNAQEGHAERGEHEGADARRALLDVVTNNLEHRLRRHRDRPDRVACTRGRRTAVSSEGDATASVS